MMAYGEANPDGPLGRHLEDLSFVRASKAGVGMAVARGVAVKRVRKSGAIGSEYRKTQRRGKVRRTAAAEKRLKNLHRGVNPKAARAAETARRKRKLSLAKE